MNCEKIRGLIDAFFDHELDPVQSQDVEAHLAHCAPCSHELQARQTLRVLVKKNESSLRFATPVALRTKLAEALPKRPGPARARFSRRPLIWIWAPSLLTVAVTFWYLARTASVASGRDALIQELSSAHVRSLMVSHLTDVASTDQHTVKPWFEGKIDFAPMVNDLAAQGFPLIGGRLDYIDNRPVAVLVYQRNKHFINVFEWPRSGRANSQARLTVQRGFQIYEWMKDGMEYWAVSDLNAAELQTLTQMLP